MQPNKVEPGTKTRTFWAKVRAKVWVIVGIVGTISGALAFVPQFRDFLHFVADQWETHGSVALEGSYPGEIWKPASVREFAWLQDEWCYPSLPGFKSRFRIHNGVLGRQNSGTNPESFVTDWVNAEVFISNRGVIRLRYAKVDWPGTYVYREPNKTAEWRENERYLTDAGNVSSGNKRLVLSCRRCTVSTDGITYSCNN